MARRHTLLVKDDDLYYAMDKVIYKNTKHRKKANNKMKNHITKKNLIRKCEGKIQGPYFWLITWQKLKMNNDKQWTRNELQMHKTKGNVDIE